MGIQIELTGVQMPIGNPCYVQDCPNHAMTAVFQVGPRNCFHVCGWHLKENLEKGNWFLGNEFPKGLLDTTFVIEHNPNCPSPFLIRFCGEGKGCIDKLPHGQSADRIGFGKTIGQAFSNAFYG